MTRLLLLATDPELTARIGGLPGVHSAYLDKERIDSIVRLGGLAGIIGPDPEQMPDIVVLGDGCPLPASLSIAESLSASKPGLGLVLVAEPDTDLVLRAMRSGIRDIVAPSVSEDELKVLVHRVFNQAASHQVRHAAEAAEEENTSRIIVVASPKGGVGKSTIATNLAVALSQNAPMETVLVDLDLQFGNVGTLLGLTPLHTIDDAFESTAVMDTLILKTFLTVHPSGFYVLCGATSPTLRDKVSPEQIKHLLTQLSSQFPYIVVDTESGIDQSTMSAIDAATDLVLVSSMDTTSASGLRKQMGLLGRLGLLPASRHIVLNFADRHSGVNVRQVESEIGLPVEVVVPRSFEVMSAGNLGHSLIETRARGPVAKAIRHLVTRIREDEQLAIRSKHRGIEVA